MRVFLGTIFVAVMLCGSSPAPAAWNVQTVDWQGTAGYNTGMYASLRLDADGHPHIGYYDSINGRLKYGRWDGSQWLLQQVDDSGADMGRYSALALGTFGQIHLSYRLGFMEGPVSYALQYAYSPDGVTWTRQTVDAGAPWIGAWTSIALDDYGYPRISYVDSTVETACYLKYARWNGANWSVQTVYAGGAIDGGTSLALDGDDNPAIAFADVVAPNTFLRYAFSSDGTNWDVATVDGSGSAGKYPSLAFDNGGAAHISYYDVGGQDLKYASLTWMGWLSGTVDSEGTVGEFSSLAFDLYDRPRISYFRRELTENHGTLKCAFWGDSGWVTMVVDGDLVAYYPTSIALDPAGNPRIAYTNFHTLSDYAMGELKYAAYTPPAPWVTDYNGDGTSDIAVFRGSSGMWSVRNVTRLYFGGAYDSPAPADYNGDGVTDVGIFRPAEGLWSARDVTRFYLGASADTALPGDYDGDGTAEGAIFRQDGGLWTVRGLTRAYFGTFGDWPVPGWYGAGSPKTIAVFRSSASLWSIRDLTRFYFGGSADYPVPGDYNADLVWEAGICRGSENLWSIRGVTRAYFGSTGDIPVPADYGGRGKDEMGVFRAGSNLWSVRDLTRAYFGEAGDLTATR